MKPPKPADEQQQPDEEGLDETLSVLRARDFSLLAQQRVFRSLDKEILALMYSSMSERHFAEGDTLIRQGDKGSDGRSG